MGEPGPGSTLVDLADGALPASPSGSLSAGQQPMPSGGIAVRLAWTQSGLAGVGLEAAAELAEVGLGARLGRELGRGRGLDSRSPVEPAADRSASPAGAAPWRPNGGKPAGEATSAWARRMLEDEARRAGVIGPAEPAEWARDGAGRPVLDNAPNWHCSISHSGPLVAVAWARRPVGIDVELTSRRVSRAVRRRLAPDERAHIEAAAEEDASRRFLEIWTKKEAYLKWRGTGLAGGLESFSVLAPEPFGVVFHPVTLPGDERFVGHVCAAP